MESFEEVYQKYLKEVYCFLLRLSGDREIAEELTQQTFAIAFEKLENFRGECKLSVWLCQIAKHEYYAWTKKQKRYANKLDENHADQGEDLLNGIINQENGQIIRKILHDLQEPYKEVFMLRVMGEVSYRDIGQLFSKSESWARVTYYRAKKMIVEKMLAAVIIGGIAGGVSAVIYELMKKGIDAGIRTINGTIQQYIFPTLIIIAVVTVVVGEYSLYRLKNVYKEMKDADEDRFYELDYEEEKWGAWTSGVNLVSQVACIIILSFGYSLKYIESGKSRYFLFACIIFILCYFYDIYLSVRYVKAIQAAHPEKKGDPTSRKFTEQWVESCDEAEKEIIYKSAYKTYIVLNKVIPLLLLLTLIANMFLNTGILAVLVVAVIYLVTGMTYIRSCMVSKAKKLG